MQDGGDRLKRLDFFLGQIIAIFFILTVIIVINNHTSIGLTMLIFNSIFLLFWSKRVAGSYTNATVMFIAFGIFYGLSGPVNALWGEGLHRLFTYPYAITPFLISYSIANLGMLCGIMLYHLLRNTKEKTINNSNYIIEHIYIKRKLLYSFGLIFVLIASTFELINIIRIGGFALLFSGKAMFQSNLSGLTLTLPATEIMVIGFSLFSLYLGVINYKKVKENKVKLKIFIFVLLSMPYIGIKTILGQRSLLLTLAICFVIGFSYFNPIKKIKPKLIVILLIMYVFLAFVFANRGIVSLLQDNPKEFFETALQRERIVKALNPGINEFGAAFGNYSQFHNKNGSNFNARLGTTYIKGLVVPIPSFVYPGSKPKQITYEFRDELFASEASRGSIAGTGFSSILEAYMNFKNIGVFFIYLLVGYFLQKLDKKYRYKNLFLVILYIASISQVMSFHRSAFGTIYSNIVLRALILIPIVWVINSKILVSSKTNKLN